MATLFKHNILVHMFNSELKVQSRVPIPKQPGLDIGTT